MCIVFPTSNFWAQMATVMQTYRRRRCERVESPREQRAIAMVIHNRRRIMMGLVSGGRWDVRMKWGKRWLRVNENVVVFSRTRKQVRVTLWWFYIFIFEGSLTSRPIKYKIAAICTVAGVDIVVSSENAHHHDCQQDTKKKFFAGTYFDFSSSLERKWSHVLWAAVMNVNICITLMRKFQAISRREVDLHSLMHLMNHHWFRRGLQCDDV